MFTETGWQKGSWWGGEIPSLYKNRKEHITGLLRSEEYGEKSFVGLLLLLFFYFLYYNKVLKFQYIIKV